MVVVASVVTLDWVPPSVCLLLECVYLVGYAYWPRLQARLGTRSGSPELPETDQVIATGTAGRINDFLLNPPERHSVSFLDGWLLVVTVAGLVIIFFFGFGKHLLSHPLPYFTHAQGWEAGAILWTYTFLLYYMVKVPSTKNIPADSFIKVLVPVVSTGLLVLAWLSMKSHQPTLHVITIWAIGVCFLLVDSLVVRYHPDPKERDLSRASRKWADWPMVASLGVLFLYLVVHPDTEQKEVFVSGIVACQLLISNSVFVVMEFGLLASPNSAKLSGLVQETGGSSIKGAVLTAKSLSTKLSQITSTDNEGRFHFLYLPAGKSVITVEAAGFATLSQEITLTAGDADDLQLKLASS
jgi:hypothetical protein